MDSRSNKSINNRPITDALKVKDLKKNNFVELIFKLAGIKESLKSKIR